MTFDNSKTIISIRIKLFVITVLLLAYLAVAYVAKIVKFPLLGLNDTVWTFSLAIVWVIIAFFPMFLNYQFISYSDEGDFIVFRFFTSGIISGRKNSIEIHKTTFTGYKIKRKAFGLIQSLILYQRIQSGVAKYPPIYISSLKRDEKSRILRSLDSLTNH